MSGYFGALMRASGMTIAARAPAMAHVEPPVVEIDVERRSAAIPARTVQTALTPPQAVGPIPVLNSGEQPAPPTLLAADADAHGGQAGLVGTAGAHPRAAGLVRAAMQWVAADTQHARSVAQVVPPRGQSLPAPGEEAGVIPTTQTLGERGVDIPPQTPAHATPAVPDTPLARDEVVEISIGAIHVRVDAPAQTIASPAATPPAAARRGTTATPPRSALSRRALRRI